MFLVVGSRSEAGESPAATRFRTEIQPLLKEYCFDCHGDGEQKGEVRFDPPNAGETLSRDPDLWFRALKNLRAGLMPPPRKPQPSPEQRRTLERWIKSDVFAENPRDPDPGRVTLHRLNRAEYRNTIRDLTGVDYNTDLEFPPDDSGRGFDNLSDSLTLPPMLLEKYLAAAQSIVARAVPTASRIPAEGVVKGRDFTGEVGPSSRTNRVASTPGGLNLAYAERASVTNRFRAAHAGKYHLLLDFTANERFVEGQFDYNKCRLVFRVDGRELHAHEYTREGGKGFHYEFDQDWTEGEHPLEVEILPLTPKEKQVRSLTLRLDSVTIRGPLTPEFYVAPKDYARFFPREVPSSASARRTYAREILGGFARKAYRRPVDERTIDRLVTLAESATTQGKKSFEQGIGQAMTAILASPRFLFREESAVPAPDGGHPWVDEHALASRLSYFFWSSMPDPELMRLADRGELRGSLKSQTRRLMEDKKSEALVRNFVGQWLQARDIETIPVDARQVLFREAPVDPEYDRKRARFRELRDRKESTLGEAEKQELDTLRTTLFGRFNRPPKAELTGDLRRAMRQETEKSFDYVLRQDRPLLELLNADYTFLNERLATHYGLTNLNVKGDDLRRVSLPEGSPRGGILTQGTLLAVTSNPTRTSPVKRGLFILENLLGAPPPPPPANVPPLEDATKGMRDKTPTLRETLALHREKPLCASCHNRMDPLGLALENFNAMGMWRDQERGQPIDATGTLLSGERFSTIQELKRALATGHATEFYRTVTEKLLTYALGRGLDYRDVGTVDRIVDRLEASQGRPSELIAGIIDSPQFQKTEAGAPARGASRQATSTPGRASSPPPTP